MAAIGKIRKHGVALMIIIGIALLAFIVGDLTQVIPSITNRYLVVQVNDNKVRYDRNNTYQTYYEQNRLLYSFLQDNETTNEDFDSYIHELTWEQFKYETLIDEQLDRLGMGFSQEMIDNLNEELVNSLQRQYTTEAEQYLFDIAQRYQREGISIEQIKNAFENINDYRGREIYEYYKAIERIALLNAKENTYFGLAVNSLYFSKKLTEQMSRENDTITVALAGIDINHPNFDTLKIEISDEEAEKYFKNHKDHFTTPVTIKDIDFAVVPIVASHQDEQSTRDSIAAIYKRFQQYGSISEFAKNETRIDRKRVFTLQAAQQNIHNIFNYDYKKASFAQIDTALYLERGKTAYQKLYPNDMAAQKMPAALDSFIYTHPAGTFIEPRILDNGMYYFGKITDIATRPDSIQVLGLVVNFKIEGNVNKDAPTRTKEAAKIAADSIANAINGQPVSVATALMGKYPNCFNDTIQWLIDGSIIDTTYHNLYNRLIKTDNRQTYIWEQEQNGYYIIFQVLEKRAWMEKRQYVLYPVPVRVSPETEKLARTKANSIAGKSGNIAELNQLAQQESAAIVHGTNITNMQSSVNLDYNRMLRCRPAISWAFDEGKEIKNDIDRVAPTIFKGQIYHFQSMNNEPVTDNDAYIIASVKATVDARDPQFNEVKDHVFAEMKSQKKAAAVEKQLQKELVGIGNMTDLVAKYHSMVDTIKIHFSEFNGNIETAVVGKIAALPADGKPHIVSSNQRIYLVSVQKIEKNTAPVNENTGNAMINFAYFTTLKQRLQRGENLLSIIKEFVYNDLQRNTKIIDRRHVFYKSN